MRRAGWALLLALGGCAGAEPMRSYLLDADAAAPEGGAAAAAPRLLLRRIAVPRYLDSTDLLARRGPSELVASPRARWAERLSDGVDRALAAAMEARLGRGSVLRAGADAGAAALAPWELVVEIDAFDCAEGGGACRLGARWAFRRRAPGAEPRALRVEAWEEAAAAGEAAQVAAMNRLVARLALRLAAELPPG